MKNIVFKCLMAFAFLMSANAVMAQYDLIVDHKTMGKLGDETAAALALPEAKAADEIKSFKVISSNATAVNPDDIRGMKALLKYVQNFDFSEVNVTLFDASMFQAYTSLVSIGLPANTAAISKYMFKGCTKLASITSWGKVRRIEIEAFSGCTSFNELAFPETLEEVGTDAFRGCKALTTNTLPDGLKIIGRQAFRESNVTISQWPSAIEEIGNRAFCITPAAFTTWPENIPEITAGVFINCSQIKEFTIPASVTAVGGAAFRLSSNIVRHIYLSSETPLQTIVDDEPNGGNSSDNPFGANKTTFDNQENVTLHIPASGKHLYKAANYWKNMKYATTARATTNLSGSWTQAELESMDISDENLTSLDMTGITLPTGVTLSGISNPNFIIYLNDGDDITVDKGFVIKGGRIDEMTLTDKKPFSPSKSFSAGTVSYSRPAAQLQAGEFVLETICLPFEAEVPAGYVVKELTGSTAEEVALGSVTTMLANTPYVIWGNGAGNFTFSSTEQTIDLSNISPVANDGPYTYNATFNPITVTAEAGEKAIYISDGTEFRLTGKGAVILPFRAYLEGEVRGQGGGSEAQVVRINGAGPTSIGEKVQVNDIHIYSVGGTVYVDSPQTHKLNIYSMDGRLVRSELLNEGENEISGLSKGLYIIENKKVIVK